MPRTTRAIATSRSACNSGKKCALRYCYLAADVAAIQVSHHNLGNYFGYTGQLYPALAHHLAAALLRVITGSEGAEDWRRLPHRR